MEFWAPALDDYGNAIEVDVWLAQGGDGCRAAPFDGADVHEQDLVLEVVNDSREAGAELDQLTVVQLALKDGELQVLSPTEHELVNLA